MAASRGLALETVPGGDSAPHWGEMIISTFKEDLLAWRFAEKLGLHQHGHPLLQKV
jgi:hypothetical protein